MSEQASKFLREWVGKNVRPVPYLLIPNISKELHNLCVAGASQCGIPKSDLEKAAGGNLRRFIAGSFQDAQDAAVRENSLVGNGANKEVNSSSRAGPRLRKTGKEHI